jgi:hypothetical protein
VLVIIGLIVGGVLVGQDVTRSGRINSINADVERYAAAVNTFRVKYNAYPGDMETAGNIWGLIDGTPKHV